VADTVGKVKTRQLRMRACNEATAGGKFCLGHLKRWYGFGPELAAHYGPKAELYRCERCNTVYLPHPGEKARTGTLAF
jgi:hypothetical protein